MPDKLAKAQSETLTTSKTPSNVSSGVMAVRMLVLAAKVTGYKEISQSEIDFWLKILEPYPAERIEQSFGKFLETAEFFPKPAEILALLNAKAEEVHAQREADKTAAMLEENRQIRERLKAVGLPYGIDQYQSIIKQALETVRRIPAPEPSRRARLQARLDELRKAKQANQEQVPGVKK